MFKTYFSHTPSSLLSHSDDRSVTNISSTSELYLDFNLALLSTDLTGTIQKLQNLSNKRSFKNVNNSKTFARFIDSMS